MTTQAQTQPQTQNERMPQRSVVFFRFALSLHANDDDDIEEELVQSNRIVAIRLLCKTLRDHIENDDKRE